MDRRRFLQLGVATAALGSASRALAQGGHLRMMSWQAPTALNPYFATGAKDNDAARLFYEPLIRYGGDGELVPVLATAVPTRENGGLARDGRSVTISLKRNVVWADGTPFTAADVVFNWEYAADPATASAAIGDFRNVSRIEALDSHTIKGTFTKPLAVWETPFINLIIPRHRFEPYRGAKSREAPENLKPLGTGPFRCLDFVPNDRLRAERNPTYHVAGQPGFATVEIKGGGDAVSAARAVLQTGEFDYATNLQVEDEILKRLEAGGRGRVVMAFGGDIEFILLNQSDPNREVDGERSSATTTHPVLSDRVVRTALSLLIDRASIQQEIYGRTAATTANILNGPAAFDSRGVGWEFSVAKANALLDANGWVRGSDGVRVKDKRPLRLVFQTSVNAPRQKTQAIVKQACTAAGIALELKAISPNTFFSSDPGNPDTVAHFYADLQMFSIRRGSPDPQGFMEQWVSWEMPSKANKWQGANRSRWRNEEFDRLFRLAEAELDAAKRAALFVRMNDLLIREAVVLPVARRARVAGVARTLRHAEVGAWGSEVARVAAWRREA